MKAQFLKYSFRSTKLIIIVALALNFISGTGPAGMKDTNAKIKAVFLYNFTKYIEWPVDKREGSFIIGVLGQTNVFSELSESAHLHNKKVSVRNLNIKSYNDEGSIKDCHMLFIPNDHSQMLNTAIKRVMGKHTLIVTDKAGLAKTGGSDINFVVLNNKVKFEMNKATVSKNELKVSTMLSNLAILVN